MVFSHWHCVLSFGFMAVKASGEDVRCLQVAFLVAEFSKCLLNLSITKPTTATCAGCGRRGLDRNTPFSRRRSSPADEDDRRPSIMQLNPKRLTASKVSVIEQLAYKNRALVIVLQETYCTTTDKLVFPNFSLNGSVLSRNHGFAISTLLSKGPPTAIVICKSYAFKASPTAIVMCKYLAVM